MLLRRFGPGTPVWVVGTMLLVFALGATSLLTTPSGSAVAIWWPAAGVAIGALALSPRRWWPILFTGVVIGSLGANLIGGHPLRVAIGYSLFNALEALVAAAVLRRGRRADEIALRDQTDLVRLLLAAALGALTLGSGAAVVAALHGGDGWGVLRSATPSHFSATVLLLPVFLAHRSPPPSPHRSSAGRVRSLELALQSVTLLLAVTVCFRFSHLSLAALPLPLLTWAAFRFGHRVVAWQMLAVAVAITLFSARGYGPFTGAALEQDPLLVASLTQAYLTSMVLLCLPVAVALTHSDRLYADLRETQHLADKTLSTTDCLVLVTDVTGHLLRVNPAAQRMLGRSEESLVGTPAWDLVPLHHRDQARAMFRSPDGSSLPSNIEGRLVDTQGELRRLLWSNGVVRDDEGNATHLVMTGLDVTAELNAAGQTAHLLRADIDTAIIGLDLRGRITLVNSGAERILAQTVTQLRGVPFLRLLSGEELAQWATTYGAQADFGSLLTQTLDRPRQDWQWLGDGTSTTVSMSLSSIHDEAGDLIGYLCVGSDVTAVRERQKILVDALDTERSAVERLRDLDVAKDQFVTTISHELRTPVATIVGYTEMLVDGAMGELSPAQVKALGAMNRNGERLVGLVDNLLTLAGLTSDSFGWERDRVDVVAVVRATRDAVAPLLIDRELEITYDLPADAVAVGGDLGQLTLMLTNLLSNAVKFTEDGGHVQVSLSSDADAALLTVTDDGLGIPEDEQQHLFGRFWRSSTSVSRHIQGTGLGLATVQAVVAAHGGQVEIDSAHLGGTTVRVRLPLHQERGRRVASS